MSARHAAYARVHPPIAHQTCISHNRQSLGDGDQLYNMLSNTVNRQKYWIKRNRVGNSVGKNFECVNIEPRLEADLGDQDQCCWQVVNLLLNLVKFSRQMEAPALK